MQESPSDAGACAAAVAPAVAEAHPTHTDQEWTILFDEGDRTTFTQDAAGPASKDIPVPAPGGTSEAKEATNLSAESEMTTDVGNAAGEASAVAESSPAAPGVEEAAAEATPRKQTKPMHEPAVAGETARPQANMHGLQDAINEIPEDAPDELQWLMLAKIARRAAASAPRGAHRMRAPTPRDVPRDAPRTPAPRESPENIPLADLRPDI